MILYKNTYKRRAILMTLLFHLLLVFLFYSFGLKYMDPKIEEGIAIEFGFIDEGMLEDITQSKDIQLDPIEEINTSNTSFNNDIYEPIVSQDIEEVEVAISNKEDMQVKLENDLEKIPEASKELQNALSTLFQSNFNKEFGTKEIISSKGSIQGSVTDFDLAEGGEVNSSDGYELGNRNAILKPKPNYLCSESGRVVIRVWVNNEGITYKAELDLKNTTETDACLVREARKAALQTTWLADQNVGPVQIGSIIYNFIKQ